MNLDDNDLGLTRLDDVYRELRKGDRRCPGGQEADICRRLGTSVTGNVTKAVTLTHLRSPAEASTTSTQTCVEKLILLRSH